MHIANEKGSGKRSSFIKIIFQEPFCFTNLRKIDLHFLPGPKDVNFFGASWNSSFVPIFPDN